MLWQVLMHDSYAEGGRQHSVLRKFLLLTQLLYMLTNLAINWFTVANMYLSVRARDCERSDAVF